MNRSCGWGTAGRQPASIAISIAVLEQCMQFDQPLSQRLGVTPHLARRHTPSTDMLVPQVKTRQIRQRVLGRQADGLTDAGGFVVAQVLRSFYHVGAVVPGLDLDDVECEQHEFNGRLMAPDGISAPVASGPFNHHLVNLPTASQLSFFLTLAGIDCLVSQAACAQGFSATISQR